MVILTAMVCFEIIKATLFGYYVPDIKDYNSSIGQYPEAFLRDVSIEGTGSIGNGEYLVSDGNSETGYSVVEEVKGRYGPVLPYRTAAANPNFLSSGDAIYVSALKTFLVITDTGGGLKYGEIDVFVGNGVRAYQSWLDRDIQSSNILKICRKER